MIHPITLGKIKLVASTDPAPDPIELDPGMPFHIAILGDFSGRANRNQVQAVTDGDGRRPLRIDRDNFDRVMTDLDVGLRLHVAGDEDTGIVLRFRELEDFHPDRIYERAEAFRALREVRRKLDDPATFEATARQMGSGGEAGPEPGPRGPARVPTGHLPGEPAPPPEDLLAQILAESRGRAEAPDPSPAEGCWAAFLDRITAPYRVAASDPRQADLVDSVDAATGQLMRDILHHPDFQALEAAWRSLHFLTRRLETDEHLTLSLLDVSKAEMAADLDATRDLRSSGMSKLLDETTGGQPWAVLIGDLTFEPTRADMALLDRLAGIARHAGAPFLAAASPRFLGCESLATTPDPDDWSRTTDDSAGRADWEVLRRRSDAVSLGLALPRVLLRLPYGREGDPVESFDFEEMAPAAGPEIYLWGNPAFLLAELLGRSFSRSGWDLQPGEIDEVDGLPIHISRRDGEPRVTSCSEALLSDRAAEIILDRGLMPLLSFRDRDIVRLVRFQSIAEPSATLAGRWQS